MNRALSFLEIQEQFLLEGSDALDFCHRIFSRDLKRMQRGEMKLSLLLSPEARVLSQFWVCREEGGLLLITSKAMAEVLEQQIETYRFSESFQMKRLDPVSLLIGEAVSTPLSASGIGLKQPNGDWTGSWRGLEFHFQTALDHSEASQDNEARLLLIQHLVPLPGVDFPLSQTLVFEMGFEELCEQNKGCYIGQEIVERVRSRGGSSPKKLCLFRTSAEIQTGARFKLLKDLKNEYQLGSVRFAPKDSANYALSILPKRVMEAATENRHLKTDLGDLELLRSV